MNSVLNKENSIFRHIKLEKPLIIFDLETTGLSISSDRIIQLAFVKYFPSGLSQQKDYYINPEIEIGQEATEIHGLTNEDLVGKPTFKKIAKELYDIFNDCYYGGYNIIFFDLPILRREFLRVGMDFNYSNNQIIDSCQILRYMEPRSLSFALKYYCHKEHDGAHNAIADVQAVAEILEKQLSQYDEIRDIDFLNKIHAARDWKDTNTSSTRRFYWKKGEAHFGFSKYKGKKLSYVAQYDPKFLDWILQADFPKDLKTIVKEALAMDKRENGQKA